MWWQARHGCECLQYVAMEVINPEHIITTLDQIGGNARVKRDLVRMKLMTLILSAQP